MENIILISISLFLVSSAQISNVYIANIFYYFVLIFKQKFSLKNNKLFVLYLLFVVNFLLSIINYLVILKGQYNVRFIIQAFFTLQYFIFCLKLDMDFEKFELWFKNIAVAYSAIILGTFF